MRGRMQNQRGFTLLEITFALLLLMFVSLGAIGMFIHAVKYNTGADDRAIAIAIAEEKMEEIRGLPFNDALLAETAAGGVLYDPDPTVRVGRSFSVRRIVVDESATLKKITVRVTPQGANGQWAKTPVEVVTRRASTEVGPYMR